MKCCFCNSFGMKVLTCSTLASELRSVDSSCCIWTGQIQQDVFEFIKIVFGTSKFRDLCVEFPSVCCVMLEHLRQVVVSCNNLVNGRVVKLFRISFRVFEWKQSSLSVWLLQCWCYVSRVSHHRVHRFIQQFEAWWQRGSRHHLRLPATWSRGALTWGRCFFTTPFCVPTELFHEVAEFFQLLCWEIGSRSDLPR